MIGAIIGDIVGSPLMGWPEILAHSCPNTEIEHMTWVYAKTTLVVNG